MSHADKTAPMISYAPTCKDGSLLRERDLLPLLPDQVNVSDILVGGSTVLLARALEPPGDLTGSFAIHAQANQLSLRIDNRPVTTSLVAFYA